MASVKICDGRTVLYQWDTGVRLEMCGCSRVTECHFVTSEGIIKRDVVDNICDVPDAALKQAGKLIVYAFSRTEDEGTTRHEFRLAVYSRPKPADYIDPPDEYDNLEALAERIAPLIPGGGGGGIAEETDPTVPGWAKAEQKPTYTAEEVGALPADAEIVDQTARDGVATLSKEIAKIPEPYILPIASANTLGGVKVGKGLQMDGDVLGVKPQDEYDLIESVTLENEVIRLILGGTGNEALNLSDCVVLIYSPAAEVASPMNFFAHDGYGTRITGTTISNIVSKTSKNAEITLERKAYGYKTQYRNNNTAAIYGWHDANSASSRNIAKIVLEVTAENAAFPVGTKIDLWGVRENA